MPTPSSQPNPNFDFAEPVKRSPPVPDAFKAPPPGSVAKFEPPPPTRIFPQPINPPPAPTPAPAPAPKSLGRTGGRIAGSFKMPPGSGAAARGGAAVIGRRVPYVALAFLAYDAYQLACSFQLIPGAACPRPDNPSPGATAPPFQGGQCSTMYTLRIYGIVGGIPDPAGGTDQYITNTGSITGPIKKVDIFRSPSTNRPYTQKVTFYITDSGGRIFSQDRQIETIGDWNGRWEIHRNDGLPDNCGSLPGKPAGRTPPDSIFNINNHKDNINININIPNPRPPSPQPKPAPRQVAPPSPLPDINIDFGDNYFGGGDTDYDFDIEFNFSPAPKGNFNDYPDIFNNFPPSPQPQTKDPDPFPKENPPPQPAPQPKPLPELPPPLPDKLPENSTDEDRYIYRQNKETLDKVYKANAEILEIQTEQLKQRKILENIQSLLDFEVEGSQLIKRCDDIEIFYSYKDKVLKAINKQLQHVQAIEQTIINEVCEVQKESIVASPDWWQVRLRADVPQIALVFRALGTRTYHKITLPHPLNVNKLSAPPIPTYKKGNWQGEIVCVDNSKFLVNCETKLEAERVVNVALSLIDPLFTGAIPRLYFAERKGITVSTGDMLATAALYFSKGQQKTMPDWRVAFKYL